MSTGRPGRAVTCAVLLTLGACGGGGAVSQPGPVPTTTPPAPSDATVGPGGGTVSVAGGAAVLVVPPGALAAPTGLSLRAATRGVLDPHAVAGSAYDLEPAGVTFAVPATLTLRYDVTRAPSGIDPAELRVSVLPGETWQPIAGGTADPSASTATAGIGGAGKYGVWWPGPSGPCPTAGDEEFDFWLGSWNYTQEGAFPGTNDITKESGCLVEEHFLDTRGTRGRSVSFKSRVDGRWHQTYVDSVGGRLVLIGQLDGRRMVLLENPGSRYVWETLDGTTVRYAGELSRDGGLTWTSGFEARYTRR